MQSPKRIGRAQVPGMPPSPATAPAAAGPRDGAAETPTRVASNPRSVFRRSGSVETPEARTGSVECVQVRPWGAVHCLAGLSFSFGDTRRKDVVGRGHASLLTN